MWARQPGWLREGCCGAVLGKVGSQCPNQGFWMRIRALPSTHPISRWEKDAVTKFTASSLVIWIWKQNLPVHLNPPSPNTDPEGLNLPLSPSGLLPWPADLHPILGVSGPPQSAAHILPWHAPALILTYANVVLGLIVRTNCLLVSLQINISLPSNDSVVLPQSKSPCEVPSKFSRISIKASSADPPTQSVNQSLWISVEFHWFALAEDLD